ncbi:MAG: bifunctional proline dehydrogenase/L-glutamate gamma-semialdehyde dehydrogenase, partial [Methylococcales bacterium]|nr:bifunctional proline dehydrogenase/L-glutamate gamma-semialdehyde dehydrogenase [Methylococcales bacterium]
MAPHTVSEYYSAIGQQYLCDDSQSIKEFSTYLNNYDLLSINKSARTIVTAIRRKTKQQTVTEAFLHEYQLNSQEGIILMGMAEALLRIPDAATQDLLIREKLTSAKWHKHLNHSPSFLVNCATQALAFSGRLEQQGLPTVTEWLSIFNNLTIRLGSPLIHVAIKKAMRLLAYRFILAQSMDSALNYCQRHKNYLYSFDRLGEAALTTIDAARYYQDYLDAIEQLSQQSNGTHLMRNPNISVKLSALYPRYELNHYHRAITSLTQQLLTLANKAQQAQITLTIDAEESERLMMSLAIFSNVFNHPDLKDYEGLGLAVQAYQKRSIAVIHWLSALAQHRHKIIPIRLVKGAYWDYEIKQAQQQGLVDYPVFTEKIMTDCSYLACAQLILSQPNVFYPQFATHNAHTIAAIYSLGKNHTHYEFQRLYGMGEQLYDEIMTVKRWPVPCRIYAPVGSYKDLLPYLVRRLLENGANTSFISLLENPEIPIDDAIADPISKLKAQPFPFKAKLIRPP